MESDRRIASAPHLEWINFLRMNCYGSIANSCHQLQLSGQDLDVAAAVIDIQSVPSASDGDRAIGLPKDVIVIIDTSGSMSGVINDVRETAVQIAGSLQPADRMSIVTFSDQAKVSSMEITRT